MTRAIVSSWGRLSRRIHHTIALRDRLRISEAISADPQLPAICFGNGRSYGDQALNEGGPVWTTRGLDRFISFDKATGFLRCESGVTLGEVNALTMPHGWFLPVTPGTQFATLGGAIANDVHGKNHHRHGTFGEHVDAITLNRTDGSVIRCGPYQSPQWFRATVAGMGLTGVVSELTLRLRTVPGPWIRTQVDTFETIDEFFALAAMHTDSSEYTVAWVDCSTGRLDRTRGAFFRGDHVSNPRSPPAVRNRSAAWLPAWRLVNGASTAAFNQVYFGRQRARRMPFDQAYTSFFYPLDGVMEWNRLYGSRGFYQYQCVVPAKDQLEATREMLRLIRQAGIASFLSVLKTFADRPPSGMLSFPRAGTTLALDFPNLGESTQALFARLNSVVLAAGGRLYPAKDAVMPAAMFRAGYPNLDLFESFRDPGISSEMSRRLTGH